MSGGTPAGSGMPRWLVWAIAIKLAVIALIVGAVVWYANR